jgi:hypothetical protein
MNFKTTSELYYEKSDNIKQIIKSVISENINIYPTRKCVVVNFMFRGEVDYSLNIPLEYCDTTHLLKDYYDRFKEFIKDEPCLSNCFYKAEEFYQLEMKKLNQVSEEKIEKLSEEIYNLREYGNVIVSFRDKDNTFFLICDKNGKRIIQNKIGVEYKGFKIEYSEQESVEIHAL